MEAQQANLNFAGYECYPVEDDPTKCPVPTLFRTRKPNWTEQESVHLSVLVDSHAVLRSRMMDSNTNQQKSETWALITSRINALNPAVQRTVEEVKRRWQNMYSTAKREAAEFRRATSEAESSGGPAPEPHQFLCPISLRLVETFGGVDNLGSLHQGEYSCEFNNDLSSETGSSRSRVPSVEVAPAPLMLPMATASPQERPIKREEFAIVDTGSPSVYAPAWRSRQRVSANATTQTDGETMLRYEMMVVEKEVLEMKRERQRLRLHRDRMRLAKEEKRLDLVLERKRLKNRRLREEMRREGGVCEGSDEEAKEKDHAEMTK